MNVVLISPGFPAEMPEFTRGLVEVGARVLGVGEGPAAGLPELARRHLADYLQVKSLWDEEEVTREVHEWVRGSSVDRVECLWEPGVVLAARIREALDVPGMTVEQALPFRDKDLMKQKLDEAGIRTPRHARAATKDMVRAAADEIGYPLIVKPIDGAGSADTYPIHSEDDLEQALGALGHVPEISVEEYIDGEELTYDTVCAQGEILFHNVAWYRPKPLVGKLNAWVSQQVVALRDTDIQAVMKGRRMGEDVLRALGFDTGFSHMEWFLTPDGEAVFGEIGARAPGARLVHAMNYSCDVDLFRGWAEAVCHGRLSQDTSKKYNAAIVFKRAEGAGRVKGYEGLGPILGQYSEHIANIELTPIGQPSRDWRKSVVGDGWMTVRHPNLDEALEIADRLTVDFRIVAE